MNSGHAKRIITATVAVPIVLLVILKGGREGLALLVGLFAVLGLLEYFSLFLASGPALVKSIGAVFGLALIGAFYVDNVRAGFSIFAAAFLVTALLSLTCLGSKVSPLDVLCRQTTSFIYIPFLLGHIMLIDGWPKGSVWVLFLLAVVFLGDTGAYYTGKAIGRHKLCPRISPGKTVEGAIGGLGGSVLAAFVFRIFWIDAFSWFLFAGLALLLGVAAQLGDLVESMLKRSVEAKDSGSLLPGHGGVLDRIDGLLFATPVLYWIKTCLL